MDKILEGLIEVFESRNRLGTLTYSDYYFTQMKLKKWIEELGGEVGRINNSMKYLKNGE